MRKVTTLEATVTELKQFISAAPAAGGSEPVHHDMHGGAVPTPTVPDTSAQVTNGHRLVSSDHH